MSSRAVFPWPHFQWWTINNDKHMSEPPRRRRYLFDISWTNLSPFFFASALGCRYGKTNSLPSQCVYYLTIVMDGSSPAETVRGHTHIIKVRRLSTHIFPLYLRLRTMWWPNIITTVNLAIRVDDIALDKAFIPDMCPSLQLQFYMLCHS